MPDSDSLEVSYATELAPLVEALADLERPGNYFASGRQDSAPPLLRVEGVGIVSFPVPTEQARRLIETAAERAPYGRGDATIVDESVRKVWQITPDHVQLDGKQWPLALEAILADTTSSLGRAPQSLRAEFYKFLIYDQGGFFLAHRDTEKSPGMLGTLIIVLPSEHQGGELVIRHNGRETTEDLRNLDPGELTWAAFYADCEHEVLPITDGHRLCLVYNLINTAPPNTHDTTPDPRPQIEAAARVLSDWTRSTDRATKIVYLLEHRYTEKALAFAQLKGRDAALAHALLPAASASDCVVHLAMVHIEESGWAEYHGSHYDRRSRWDDFDGDDSDPDDFAIGEVCDQDRYIAQWRNTQDEPVDFGKIPLHDDEILPLGALDDEDPDETHFSEATGNEGASFERTYLRAALVLWPEEAFDEICASASFQATLRRLRQRVTEFLQDPESPQARDRILRLSELLPNEWSDYNAPAGRLQAAAPHSRRFRRSRRPHPARRPRPQNTPPHRCLHPPRLGLACWPRGVCTRRHTNPRILAQAHRHPRPRTLEWLGPPLAGSPRRPPHPPRAPRQGFPETRPHRLSPRRG